MDKAVKISPDLGGLPIGLVLDVCKRLLKMGGSLVDFLSILRITKTASEITPDPGEMAELIYLELIEQQAEEGEVAVTDDLSSFRSFIDPQDQHLRKVEPGGLVVKPTDC